MYRCSLSVFIYLFRGGGVFWGFLSFRLYHHNTTALLHQANYSICFVFSESRVATIPSHTVSCFCCGFTPVDSVHTLPSRVIPIALGIIWPKDYLNSPKMIYIFCGLHWHVTIWHSCRWNTWHSISVRKGNRKWQRSQNVDDLRTFPNML